MCISCRGCMDVHKGGEGTDGQFHVDESGQRGGEVKHLDFLVHIINR